MRKYAAIILFACLLLPLSVMADNAGVQATALGYYLEEPTIDGDLSDWPSGLADNVVDEYLAGYSNPTGSADFSMSFKAFYNPLSTVNKLYIGVTVTDDQERTTDPSWLNDKVEMYVDGDHDHSGLATYPYDMQQYIFELDNTAIVSGESAGNELVGCEWAYTKAGTTYTFEIAITVYDTYPHEQAEPPATYEAAIHILQTGDTIGFDMSWPDQDDSTGDSWISWSPTGGKWNDSTVFGNLNLGAMQDSLEITATGDTWLLFE